MNRTEFEIQMGLNSNLSLLLQDSMAHIRRLLNVSTTLYNPSNIRESVPQTRDLWHPSAQGRGT